MNALKVFLIGRAEWAIFAVFALVAWLDLVLPSGVTLFLDELAYAALLEAMRRAYRWRRDARA